jgi:hypothetical protein
MSQKNDDSTPAPGQGARVERLRRAARWRAQTDPSLSGRSRKARDLLRFILSVRAAAGRVLTRGRRTVLAIAGEGDTALDLDIYDGNGPASYSITWLDLLICFPLDAEEMVHAELAARTDEWGRG